MPRRLRHTVSADPLLTEAMRRQLRGYVMQTVGVHGETMHVVSNAQNVPLDPNWNVTQNEDGSISVDQEEDMPRIDAPVITDYRSAKEHWGYGSSGYRDLGNNTRLVAQWPSEQRWIALVLHDTPIIVYAPNVYLMCCGGYVTPLTQARFVQFLPPELHPERTRSQFNWGSVPGYTRSTSFDRGVTWENPGAIVCMTNPATLVKYERNT